MIRRVNVPLVDDRGEPIRWQDIDLPGRVVGAEVVPDDPEWRQPTPWLKLTCLDLSGMRIVERCGLYTARTDEPLPLHLHEALMFTHGRDAYFVGSVQLLGRPRDLHVFIGPADGGR